jgi:biopolymer transport protein ExbD
MTMPKKKPRKTMSQLIPTVWFVDLANLLIFYFLATTSLNKVKGIEADIPSGQQSTTSQAKMDAQPQVVMDGESIRLNGTKMSMEDLIEQLNKFNLKEKQGEEKVVFFETSGAINYQEYYSITAAIAQAGGAVCQITVEEDKGGK